MKIFNWIIGTFPLFRWQDAIDILIVALVIYYIFLLIKETRAIQMLKGFAVLLVMAFIAQRLKFTTITWIISNIWPVFIVVFVIMFQPELRQTLIEIGRRKFFRTFLFKNESEVYHKIAEAAGVMKKKKIGGLIVIERETSLKNYIDTGTKLDGELSVELLLTIFFPKTILHDGAVIVKNGRVVAAGCGLPVTQNINIDKALGMRHRAALGVTEETDAIVVVISEEFKTISLAMNGNITPGIDKNTLEEMLILYGPKLGK